MTFLLREILLEGLGIESDLNWGTDETGISAIDLKLLPPGSGALIAKIAELGKIFKRLEEATEEQTENPYRQAILDSVDSYLDSYRTSILEADTQICDDLLTTITALTAHLEPFQHELKYINKIFQPLISLKPLQMLNKIHENVVTSPPPIDKKLGVIEHSLHQVAIAQLDGYLYFHQKLPDIFEFKDNRIIYSSTESADFLDKRNSDLLLLIVNVTSDCPDLFDKTDPPGLDRMEQWINVVSHVMSALLAQRLQQQWPKYYDSLSLLFTKRSDYSSIISCRLLLPNATAYNIDFVIKKLGFQVKIVPELKWPKFTLKCNLQPPLDMVVTQEHQQFISDLTHFLYSLSITDESLKDLWVIMKKKTQSFRFISKIMSLVKVIKDHLVFAIIVPSLAMLSRDPSKITDYLRFKAQFNGFITNLRSLFPADNEDLFKAVHSIQQAIVDTRGLLCFRIDTSGQTDEQILDQLLEISSTVNKDIRTIAETLNTGSEQGIETIRTIERIIGSSTA
ncbi:hypothetical protein TVAG_173090 [Trichomonas vaginalis G3]|uniref:Gamma tubulin complex component protein N-terminal domain-containing protein n=1 Tax=Trichomonas vaginalis (strain ATCC PRA-98 / G3) TaxID=412133 RepID=A2DF59_TRIV3|nr:gamma tubulin complex protein family [Trichomonas vaginalis G3]EAY21051.1 hypothetical protein TVAG_173090 [Trichomonas vaginalis G3]KAI5519235.1 gamma tubulin complex protein family [Trichomonas vaginalis G3]|eukprot:XP_001582037.1 hypothetical protein [Trichomonas vaginalis G3]